MTPDGDLFSPSVSLIMSDFTSLTEFDDFHKGLFLSNAMEGIVEGDLLEELDCKDDLNLISQVTEDDIHSIKTRGSPFALFMGEETTGSLQFMDSTLQLDSSTVSDELDIKIMGLTSTSSDSFAGSVQDDLLSHTDSLAAANALNCLSLDELDMAHVNPMNTMSQFLSSPLVKQSVSMTPNSEEPLSSTISLSPLTKGVADSSMFKTEVQTLCSLEPVISSPQTKLSGSSSSSSKSNGVSMLDMALRRGEGCNIPLMKSAFVQSVNANAREDTSIHVSMGSLSSDVIQGQRTHVPSIQRSQSSHALGQLRTSHCLGVRANDFRSQPMCKQEVIPLSSASCMNLFSPYQTSNPQVLSGQHSSTGAPIRRVYSTGDLQGFNGMQSYYGMKAENAIPEEATGVKIGHYTMQERKMKLHRYRQKRTERNFNKKIKYACRKTLADNRPRVRGRFARSDEIGESGFTGSDLPLIEEYEEVVTSHRPRMVRDPQAYYVANNSCVMSSTPMPHFWNMAGMKVAM